MDKFTIKEIPSHLITEVKESIIIWANMISLKRTISNLKDLTNCQLFLSMLGKIQGFKCIESIPDGNQINKIKIVVQSMMRYYQMYLMRDISGMSLDYMEISQGNDQEIVKMFVMVMGIVKYKYNLPENIPIQNKNILLTLLEYAQQLGNQLENSPQSRMLRRIQFLEDKVDQLIAINQEFEGNEKIHLQTLNSFQNEHRQNQKQRSILLKSQQTRQLTLQILQNQNKRLKCIENCYEERIKIILKNHEQQIKQLQNQLKNKKNNEIEYKELKIKNLQIQQINKQLKKQIQFYHEQIKYKKQNQIYLKQQNNIINLQLIQKIKENKQLLIQIQKFKNNHIISNTDENEDQIQINLSSCQSYNQYRVYDHLSDIKQTCQFATNSILKDNHRSPSSNHCAMDIYTAKSIKMTTIDRERYDSAQLCSKQDLKKLIKQHQIEVKFLIDIIIELNSFIQKRKQFLFQSEQRMRIFRNSISELCKTQ